MGDKSLMVGLLKWDQCPNILCHTLQLWNRLGVFCSNDCPDTSPMPLTISKLGQYLIMMHIVYCRRTLKLFGDHLDGRIRILGSQSEGRIH